MVTPDKQETTTQFLDTFALESWESVLHCLVGTMQSRPESVMTLLERAGLMEKR